MTVESKPFDLTYFDVGIQYFYSKENSSQSLMVIQERARMFTLLFIHKRD